MDCRVVASTMAYSGGGAADRERRISWIRCRQHAGSVTGAGQSCFQDLSGHLSVVRLCGWYDQFVKGGITPSVAAEQRTGQCF